MLYITTREYKEGEFVCEYQGELLSYKNANKRKLAYLKQSGGSYQGYMYYFAFKGVIEYRFPCSYSHFCEEKNTRSSLDVNYPCSFIKGLLGMINHSAYLSFVFSCIDTI